MSVKFIGYIGFNNGSETQAAVRSRVLDKDYVEAAARAQEEGGFDRVLIPFGSNSPESQIVAAHAAALTSKLGFLVAHRPGFTQPTVAARQLATLDQLSGGRVAVHIITGGADDEMARDGDTGTVKAQRYQRTDEYLTILRQEWTAAQPFDHRGDFYDIRQAFSAIKPDNLPVFFGGSSAEAIEVAGRHADVYALWGETLEAVQDTVRQVRRAAARHGRNPGFSLSLRPVIADTEEAAWKRAAEIEEQVRANRVAAGLPLTGHRPPNVGSLRLLEAARANRQDKRLWTGVAALTGAAGNSTGLVGTPEQVADAMLDYYDIGIDHFLIRGFDPLGDSILYGRELLPVVRRKVAEREKVDVALAG
ncbi:MULTISPECIES: LLM class flavin-dependent oxidoreductase [Sphingobium]|jgi:alkanesulfonate monooxygenase|uniref:Alkanesulfonate monooxygenase n=1 Tax=Sphingobium yanoikuyae TaxID=13690 RepID=A0A0J9D6B0_SPHYA|nr:MULTISPECIES: LLM class flavin-dependent oxidoreductase [Sphingobium]ATP19359.1 alkanesulfonate monooxygenase [Sphingobium yanoikuyae]KMW32729.1 alkanesulfonate monooxygenase [Sphingobium yanoikuyae]